MARILILIALAFVFYTLFKRFLKNVNQHHQSSKAQDTGENMVLCSICKSYIPASEAFFLNQQLICKNQPCKK